MNFGYESLNKHNIHRLTCTIFFVLLGSTHNWPYLLGGYIVVVTVALLLHPALPESPAYCYIISMDETKGLKGKELHHILCPALVFSCDNTVQ